jgi:hypothetical protein
MAPSSGPRFWKRPASKTPAAGPILRRMSRRRLQYSTVRRTACARHPDAVGLDRRVEIAAASVLLQEGVEVCEQSHAPSGDPK